MRPITRYLLAPALAAGVVVLFEVVRTLAFGATHLGGAGAALAFALAVAGLLGCPLWVGGGFAIGIFDAVRAGWRWGRAAAPPPTGARRVAWVIYGSLALTVVTFGVQAATIQFVRAFNKPIYQGLGAGLVAAGLVVVLGALAGPAVGALDRGFAAASRRLPAAIDPTRPLGAAIWAALVLVGGAFLAPVLRPELHTIDLRPPRLALLWMLLLAALAWVSSRRRAGRVALAGAGLLAALYAGGLGWSAIDLGGSQSRLLALDRDTLLAGPAAARLRRFGDRDGDGVSRLFGGGDCDDGDPRVRPGVYDAPGDGVDQNCTGADLVLAGDPLKAAARAAPPAAGPKWNVLLLTIDALRHDVLRTQMPNLAKVADAAVEYRHAYSHSAATYWSIPALMLSTMPSRLEMADDQTPVPSARLLTEVLRDAGFHTALFANVTVFFVRGLRQGTDVANYDTSHHTKHGETPGSEHLTNGLLNHVRQFKAGQLTPQRERFFLWAHYYDPHDPYRDVPGHPPADGSDRARYEANVRYLDEHLGRLFDGLKAEGLWENTLVIVTADHGDEFLDHGHRFHGNTVYEEMTHVPLILHVPGVGPRALETPIGHMEVAPTVLDLLGLEIPKTYLGRSRADEIRTGKPAAVQPVFFETLNDRNYDVHQVGVREGDLKLIYRLGENYFELYDLAADPAERHNVFDAHPRAGALREALGVYLDHHLYWLAKGKSGAEPPPGAPPKAPPGKPVSKR